MSWDCDKHRPVSALIVGSSPKGLPDRCPYCLIEDLQAQLRVRCACVFDPNTKDGDPAVNACHYHLALIGQIVRLTADLATSQEMERFAKLFHDEAVAERNLAWTQRDKTRKAVADLIQEKRRLQAELDDQMGDNKTT